MIFKTKFDKIKITLKNFFNFNFSRRNSPSYKNSNGCGNTTTNIHNNSQSFESFENSLNFFKAEFRNFSRNRDEANLHLSSLHDAFNKAEKAYDFCKADFSHQQTVKDFPIAAVNYYKIIISLEEEAGRVVDQYQKRLNYYQNSVTLS